jgi:Domain of unknown function (DUF4395)
VAPATPVVDARADRSAQGVVAVVLLAAFVFRQIWVVPVLGVLVGAGAAFGPDGNPFHRAFGAYVAPRLSPVTHHEDAAAVRAQDALATALLGLATVTMLIGVDLVAWVIALTEAGIAVTAATTGVHIAEMLRERFHRRG